MGILGTPEITDPKTGIKIQDYYHITENGQVVKVRWKKDDIEDRIDSIDSIDIIGSNGRIETPEKPHPNESNQVKLIYESIVVIK